MVGTNVQFEVLENYFAREVNRGSETFVIRGKDGTPIWGGTFQLRMALAVTAPRDVLHLCGQQLTTLKSYNLQQ